MSLFHDLKRLITGDRHPAEPLVLTADEEQPAPAQSVPSIHVHTFWPLAAGTSRNVHQERKVNYHNNAVSGRCIGRIGELTGALIIYPFEDMPTWLTSLHVRLTVEIEAGDVQIALLEPSGSITTLTAPCALAGQFAIINGCLALRCETDASSAKGLSYEAVII